MMVEFCVAVGVEVGLLLLDLVLLAFGSDVWFRSLALTCGGLCLIVAS